MASWRAASAGKAAVKLSTNLTGLEVCKKPHYVLGVFYGKTLRVLAKMPSDYPYRKHTEQIINERSALLKKHADPLELEKAVGTCQLEECITQATMELDLAKKLLAERAWEPLSSEPPPNQWKWPL